MIVIYRKIYLVDTENLGSSELYSTIDTKQNLLLFFISQQRCVKDLKKCDDYEIIECNVNGKNGLDFIIDTYLGYLVSTYGFTVEYTIVSNDMGFRNVVDFWKNCGIIVSQITSENISKVKIERIEQLCAKEMLFLFKIYKTYVLNYKYQNITKLQKSISENKQLKKYNSKQLTDMVLDLKINSINDILILKYSELMIKKINNVANCCKNREQLRTQISRIKDINTADAELICFLYENMTTFSKKNKKCNKISQITITDTCTERDIVLREVCEA